jgi:hypothetical protein
MAEAPQFRPVNQSLGQQPSLGPIPANLLMPSMVILCTAYVVSQTLLNLDFAWFLLLSVWLLCTWWIVVGEQPWKFTNKFIPVPDWQRGYAQYTPYLQTPYSQEDYDHNQNPHRD